MVIAIDFKRCGVALQNCFYAPTSPKLRFPHCCRISHHNFLRQMLRSVEKHPILFLCSSSLGRNALFCRVVDEHASVKLCRTMKLRSFPGNRKKQRYEKLQNRDKMSLAMHDLMAGESQKQIGTPIRARPKRWRAGESLEFRPASHETRKLAQAQHPTLASQHGLTAYDHEPTSTGPGFVLRHVNTSGLASRARV